MNDKLYEAVKKSIVEDLNIAYEVFLEEGYKNLEGVVLSLNPLKGFGLYLKENPQKLGDFADHLFTCVDFTVHLAFDKDSEDEFFPFIKK